jgi:hypothetical protein
MFRRAVWVVAVMGSLFISSFTLADSQIDFGNRGGTLSGSNSGMTLSGSTLAGIQGYNGSGLITGNLGSVSFSTGALTSGTLQAGATFAQGGTFNISSAGIDGLPSGTIFSGTFTAPVSWQLATDANANNVYTLIGAVSGTMTIGGQIYQVTNAPIQLAVNTGSGYFHGQAPVMQGKTDVNCRVPEAGSLMMLGASFLTLLGTMTWVTISRRKQMPSSGAAL